jgi:hypothetical protein
MPDHALDSIDSFVFDEYAFIHQEIDPISTIEHDLFAAELHGLQLLNRQYDAQLPLYPSRYLTARKRNEPTFFLCGLWGLRGSKYKKPINTIYL